MVGLRVRRRPSSSDRRRARSSTSRSWASPPQASEWATGLWPPTAGSSRTATQLLRGDRSNNSRGALTPSGAGYWAAAPTAACARSGCERGRFDRNVEPALRRYCGATVRTTAAGSRAATATALCGPRCLDYSCVGARGVPGAGSYPSGSDQRLVLDVARGARRDHPQRRSEAAASRWNGAPPDARRPAPWNAACRRQESPRRRVDEGRE